MPNNDNDEEYLKYKKLAKDNNTEMFVNSLFSDKFLQIATRLLQENDETFKKLFTDSLYYNIAMEQMAKALYKELRKDKKEE